MKKFITVHGHFYQPPRENPWTGEVDVEESAKPYHDWNERIAKECYDANTHAAILNAKGIPHFLDDRKWSGHDGNYWRDMFPQYLDLLKS